MRFEPEQISLLDPAPAPTDRLFLALYPPADAVARLTALAATQRAQHGLRGKPHAPDRFHVTLHHLGDHVDPRPDIVEQVRSMAAGAQMPAFDLEFDRVSSFGRGPRNKPFVLRGGSGLDALIDFQALLGEAMKKAGLGRWVDKAFTPHMTLLYDDQAAPDTLVEPIRWTVTDWVLVHSLLGRHRHVPLGRWPLRRRAESLV